MRRRIKNIAFMTIMSGAIMNTYAVGPGFYFGLMGGPATNDGSTVQAQVPSPPGSTMTLTTPATPKSNQFGSRLFIGYQLNKYAGFEGGLNYFTGIKYDTKNVPTCSSAQARVRNLDGSVKGIMPFGNWFDVYGRAGVAVVYQATSGALNPGGYNPITGEVECGKSTYLTKFRPTIALGASYALTQSWVIDAAWNRIMVGGIVKNVDFFGLGFSYHFVDRYCGQFLCDD